MMPRFLLQTRFLIGLAAASVVLPAQETMPLTDGRVLMTSDATILEAQETRKDLPCTVTEIKPALGFDLKFHSGYDVTLPLKEVSGLGNELTMVFRVTRERTNDPVYFTQKVTVPEIEEDARGNAFLQGIFDVGEGRYRVSWLMRDRSERVCSANWEITASLPSRDKEMALDIAPGAIQNADSELFKQEPPVARDAAEALNVKVIVNFAPQEPNSAAMQPLDTNALVSILRSVAREPRIGKFSVVAFNMQEQRVLYRQENASQIDFPALGDALKSLNLGTIDLKQLSQKSVGTEFLTGLISQEIAPTDSRPDAVIIAGPKVMLEEGVPEASVRRLGEFDIPVFYMNYNLNPQANPWRDAIGSAVRSLKGSEFTISRPRDLFFAWTEIMGRIVKSKSGRTVAGNSSAP